jgi:hypothetical protein
MNDLRDEYDEWLEKANHYDNQANNKIYRSRYSNAIDDLCPLSLDLDDARTFEKWVGKDYWSGLDHSVDRTIAKYTYNRYSDTIG